MSDVDNRIQFDDLQFALQLKLEEYASHDALRDFGRMVKGYADAEQYPPATRRDLARRVFLALRKIPGIDPIVCEDRFSVWCDGFGISAQECFEEIAHILWTHALKYGKGQADEDQ